jgi:ATP sulfurylase
MKYHTSWDWLMPVVLKCKESVDYCSDDNALKYHHIEDEMLSQLSIEDTYKAVVDFIKAYTHE